jgi:hypothetical protein
MNISSLQNLLPNVTPQLLKARSGRASKTKSKDMKL